MKKTALKCVYKFLQKKQVAISKIEAALAEFYNKNHNFGIFDVYKIQDIKYEP